MALSNEDKKDVSKAFGKKAARAVSEATRDTKQKRNSSDMFRKFMGADSQWEKKHSGSLRGPAKSKALKSKTSSFDRMNAERKSQGYKPKTDRATKGMYDFFDKYD